MPIEMTPVEGVTIDSITTVEEADLFFSFRLRVEAWEWATLKDKQKALVMASRSLRRLNYKGGTIPDNQAVKDACCEEGLAQLIASSDMANLHVTSQSVAGIHTTVNVDVERPWVAANLASSEAWSLIAPYLTDNQAIVLDRV